MRLNNNYNYLLVINNNIYGKKHAGKQTKSIIITLISINIDQVTTDTPKIKVFRIDSILIANLV